MATRENAPFNPTLLRVGADLRRLGVEPKRTGWHRVRRGAWLPPGLWETLSRDQRYEALVFATVISCRSPGNVVLAGHAAAALWGLPSIDPWPNTVAMLQPDGVSGSSRHIRPLHGIPAEPVAFRGVQVTSAARTVIDLARIATLETALAAADCAIRTGRCTHADLDTEARLLPARTRGRRSARLVVDLADGLSGSAGESLSRLQMFRANLPRPVLQKKYTDDMGLIGYVDFDLPELIGEFDGQLKYRISPEDSPEEAGEIVWREKKREDRLRRFKPVARWTWKTARTPGALARQLMSHGLRPQAKSTWIDLGARRPAS